MAAVAAALICRPGTQELVSIGATSAQACLVYPLHVVNILVVLGHEPLPPVRSKTLFGKRIWARPSGLLYVKRLYDDLGLSAIYHGLPLRLLQVALQTDLQWRMKRVFCLALSTTPEQLDEAYDYTPAMYTEPDAHKKRTGWQRFRLAITEAFVEMATAVLSALCTHPLEVLSTRQIAQHVGNETVYAWSRGFPLMTVYHAEGLSGLYAGFPVAVICDLTRICMSICVRHVVCMLIPVPSKEKLQTKDGADTKDTDDDDSEADVIQNSCLIQIATLVGGYVYYPFFAIKIRMMVNGCGLAGGMPPLVPIYDSWRDCWRHLYALGGWSGEGLQLGNSLFARRVTVPKELKQLPP